MNGNGYVDQALAFLTFRHFREIKRKIEEAVKKADIVNRDVKTLLNAVKNNRVVDEVK